MEQYDQEESPFNQEDNSAPEQDDTTSQPAQDSGAHAPESDSDAGENSEFQDKVIKCSQCGAEFVHTASAQAFYKEKGFANEPKRCPPCRKARKNQSGSHVARGGVDKQMHDATCAECGKNTQVPFKPTGSRPVYCLDCYRKQRGN